jgi:alpha/beta hydrolase fold
MRAQCLAGTVALFAADITADNHAGIAGATRPLPAQPDAPGAFPSRRSSRPSRRWPNTGRISRGPATLQAHASYPLQETSMTTSAPIAPVTYHRTMNIDGINIFYREAGPAQAPVVLLLHGFPTSSHMFRNLIPALADRYRGIAPNSPTRSTALPNSSTAYSIGSTSRATRCMSWITALRWAGDWP